MIHIFGDSHTDVFNNIDDNKIIIHHIGPCLCYSFGIEKLNRLNIKDYNVLEGDTVIFCLGEIDIRCHIHKYINENITYKKVINQIIINYFNAILENIKQFEYLKVWVYNIIPPINLIDISPDSHNKNFPFIGSNDERKKYVIYFNNKLKKYCELFNYNFFDIYNKYTDKDGFLIKQYSDNIVHIKDNIFINEFMINNKII